MATEHPPPSLDRQHVFQELYRTLTELREGVHVGRMAAHLLKNDTASTELVGLVEEGGRAVYYNALSHTLEGFQFDAHGLRNEGRETLWRNLGDAAS
jgi:hypothetical protein